MWAIEYKRDVRNYIYDSYPYTAAVWQAMKALRHTADGLPPDNYTRIGPETYHWQVADHQVIYERNLAQRRLVFTVLKPNG